MSFSGLRHTQDKLRLRICFICGWKSTCCANAQHDIGGIGRADFYFLHASARS
jgi:hypothetical protein